MCHFDELGTRLSYMLGRELRTTTSDVERQWKHSHSRMTFHASLAVRAPECAE
jgi:hypothetical protein